ncbi:MarR family transcriptional regulator [Virgisporangium aliadipatigenens]|uniref:MarR family transcriptional regulator n=1 Tax=Virgisporangium aliadipatigenens TaxID=741659 RepID=A0A8J3YZ99_9ACTN|nr:MarR family transcriptional regulator [Virgisporangium aliadipatigenens]GIJ52313.1 MarR family transcriptional regulator [Virgisporangium aliadipatigenens]
MGDRDDEDEYTAITRELGMFLRRATRLHDRRADPQGHVLDRAAFLLLARIVTGGPSRPSTLAVEMGIDLSVASRQVAALESMGLVRRTVDPADRRASLIAVTGQGEELFRQKRTAFISLLRGLLADWTPEERATFAAMLGRFNAAFAAYDEGK